MFKNIFRAAIFSLSSMVLAAPLSGQTAPDFSLKGADGKIHKLSEFKGKTVVLEWFNNDCPYVRKFYDSKTMQGLQKENTAKGVAWLTIVSSAKGREGFADMNQAKKILADNGMANTALLLDTDGVVGKLYSAKTTPHMFVIDPKGKIAYQGAIDDKPSANPTTLQGAKNYVSAALMAVEKGQPVTENSTTPYGCSVKY